MTTIYLAINNSFMTNNIVYKDYIELDAKRSNRPLTVNGEKVALTIAKKKSLLDVDLIYSTTYFSGVNSAKYLADKLDLDLILDKRLDDRKVGDLTDNNLNLRNLQEHDFDYKLIDGESVNDVKSRMTDITKEIIRDNMDSKIIFYTHNINAIALLSIWCNTGFNCEEKLVLEYNEQVIIDGFRNDYNLIELNFEGENLQDIKLIN